MAIRSGHATNVSNQPTDNTNTDTDTSNRLEPTQTDSPAHPSYIAARIVWFVAGVVISLLGLRFLLALLGANESSTFVAVIYTLSYPFAAPFFGMFSYDISSGSSRFEFTTLIAMAVYALVAFGIARLITIRRPYKDV